MICSLAVLRPRQGKGCLQCLLEWQGQPNFPVPPILGHLDLLQLTLSRVRRIIHTQNHSKSSWSALSLRSWLISIRSWVLFLKHAKCFFFNPLHLELTSTWIIVYHEEVLEAAHTISKSCSAQRKNTSQGQTSNYQYVLVHTGMYLHY